LGVRDVLAPARRGRGRDGGARSGASRARAGESGGDLRPCVHRALCAKLAALRSIPAAPPLHGWILRWRRAASPLKTSCPAARGREAGAHSGASRARAGESGGDLRPCVHRALCAKLAALRSIPAAPPLHGWILRWRRAASPLKTSCPAARGDYAVTTSRAFTS